MGGPRSLIKHLSAGEVEHVRRYVSMLLVEMGIGDTFQIILREETTGEWLSEDATDESALAGIEVGDQKHTADLFLCKGWEALTPQVKRDCLVHEMIHITHKRVDQAVYDALDADWLPFRSASAYKTQYAREIELMVDKIVKVIAPRMEEWPGKPHWPILGNVVVVGSHS